MSDLKGIKKRIERNHIDIEIMKSQYQSIKDSNAEILRRQAQTDQKLDYAIRTLCELKSELVVSCENKRTEMSKLIIEKISASEKKMDKANSISYIKHPSLKVSNITKVIVAIIITMAIATSVASGVAPPQHHGWLRFVFGF